MQHTVDQLPNYLRRYCVDQHEEKYSARDHAAWRYIMRQSGIYFKSHAVSIYNEGLAKTGISVDRIPSIAAMDFKMRELGWGAVPVEGFIPPAAFLDFQARKILPIASDMRSVSHIHYTPAPDIVHEAAGHAPIIADQAYAEYLTMYAAMAQKAIFAQEDLDVYEAIRTLSDVKENPDCTEAMIAAAESALSRANAAVSFISEAAKVARMNWWTVEYGLLGSLEDPRIYGAGLLSSVGESQNCLSAKVAKHRLSLECIDTAYNITEPQPQLFVAEDLAHLVEVLKEFEQTLSYKRGGVYGLEQAKRGRTVATTVLDSGLQISGRLEDIMLDTRGEPAFLRWSGPVQLGCADKELPEQGIAHHPSGFSSPLGRARNLPDRPLRLCSDLDLEQLGVKRGQRSTLVMSSGFTIQGLVVAVVREAGDLLLIKWRDCTVTSAGQTYFQPAWGDFDMVVGEHIQSVFGGPLDREKYGAHDVGKASTSPARTSPYTAEETSAFQAYAAVRQLRDKPPTSSTAKDQVLKLCRLASTDFQDEWLLRLELVELAAQLGLAQADELSRQLQSEAQGLGPQVQWLVHQGIAAVGTH